MQKQKRKFRMQQLVKDRLNEEPDTLFDWSETKLFTTKFKEMKIPEIVDPDGDDVDVLLP